MPDTLKIDELAAAVVVDFNNRAGCNCFSVFKSNQQQASIRITNPKNYTVATMKLRSNGTIEILPSLSSAPMPKSDLIARNLADPTALDDVYAILRRLVGI